MMHRRCFCGGVLAAAGLAFGLGLIATASVRADTPWLYGIHWYDTDGDAEVMTQSKGVWIVENVNTDSSPSASGQVSKFATAVSRGHTIIVRLQPAWGWAVPPESQMNSYLTKVQQVANTLKDYVHIWQIGNEMDNPGEYGGQYLPPADYVDRFKRIRDAIKTVNSPLGEQIVLLGPSSAFSQYLGQMLPHLDVDDLDGLTIHAYGVTSPANVSISMQNFQAGVIEQLGTIDSYQDGLLRYKPVFITEFDRCSDPSSTENVSAQFLHQAFGWLDGWNSNANNHPIVGAVWFVYKDDSGWGCYSIRNLKGGASGANNDLWDAFQYAAGFNYPAGETGPAIYVRPDTYSHVRYDLQGPPDDTFELVNSGLGTLNYTVASNAPWVSPTTTGGSNTGTFETIALTYDFSGYGYGTYDANVTISDPNALNDPVVIPVHVEMRAWGDFDGDGDADQQDFGQMQVCLVASGGAQLAPDCDAGHLHGDDFDVDADDMAVFVDCMSGADVPVDPTCATP